MSLNRPNLNYVVTHAAGLSDEDSIKNIAEFIRSKHPRGTGIIYRQNREHCHELATILTEGWGIPARAFHAYLKPEEKNAVQTAWQRGEIKVVVATVRNYLILLIWALVFMRDSRSRSAWELTRKMVWGYYHVSWKTHLKMTDSSFCHTLLPPRDFERVSAVRKPTIAQFLTSTTSYYQETGRAGRDGQPSDCILCRFFMDLVVYPSLKTRQTIASEMLNGLGDAHGRTVKTMQPKSNWMTMRVVSSHTASTTSTVVEHRCCRISPRSSLAINATRHATTVETRRQSDGKTSGRRLTTSFAVPRKSPTRARMPRGSCFSTCTWAGPTNPSAARDSIS